MLDSWVQATTGNQGDGSTLGAIILDRTSLPQSDIADPAILSNAGRVHELSVASSGDTVATNRSGLGDDRWSSLNSTQSGSTGQFGVYASGFFDSSLAAAGLHAGGKPPEISFPGQAPRTDLFAPQVSDSSSVRYVTDFSPIPTQATYNPGLPQYSFHQANPGFLNPGFSKPVDQFYPVPVILPTAVELIDAPEPGTFWLLGLAGLGAWLFYRRP